MSLLLEKESFDTNAAFGDPYAATSATGGGGGNGYGVGIDSNHAMSSSLDASPAVALVGGPGPGNGPGSGSSTMGGGSFLPPVSSQSTHLNPSTAHTSSSSAAHSQAHAHSHTHSNSNAPLVSASSTMYPPAPSLTMGHPLGGGAGGTGGGLPSTTGAGTWAGAGAGTWTGGVVPPLPVYPYKLLEINLISVGHDSERLTSSVEVTKQHQQTNTLKQTN